MIDCVTILKQFLQNFEMFVVEFFGERNIFPLRCHQMEATLGRISKFFPFISIEKQKKQFKRKHKLKLKDFCIAILSTM